MKKTLKLLIFFLLSANLFQVVFAQNNNFNRTRTFDVQHYLIRTTFDRKEHTIFGETTISLKPLKDNFKSFALDGADLKFYSIKLDADSRDLQFRVENEKVYIALDKEYSPNDLIKIRLKYSAKPKKGVYFVNAEREDGEVLHDAQIWTQGEAEETHYWFPSYDFPDDKAMTEQFLTVGPNETAISNGELIETTPNADGSKTFHFKTNFPHSVYLTSFVIGNYVKFSELYKNIPLTVYLYPGKERFYKKVFGNTAQMMQIYEELTGIAFPYNKYEQTIAAHFALGGMENITATTLSDRDIFFSEENSLVVEDIISHELSHSWFGDLVTCRNWSELWLNESFATFMEAAYREKMYGRSDYLRKITQDRDIYFDAESKMKRKHGLFNQSARPDDSIFDAVTYQKGGAVLHTLRETVGDTNFWKAINIYLNKYKYENVETADLQRVFEDVSKQNLDWFFKQWIYGVGFPKLNLKYKYDKDKKQLNLTVNQTQKPEDLIPPAFILPLELEILTKNGAVSEKISITKREEKFSFNLNDAPTEIVVDKDLKVPLKKVTVEN